MRDTLLQIGRDLDTAPQPGLVARAGARVREAREVVGAGLREIVATLVTDLSGNAVVAGARGAATATGTRSLHYEWDDSELVLSLVDAPSGAVVVDGQLFSPASGFTGTVHADEGDVEFVVDDDGVFRVETTGRDAFSLVLVDGSVRVVVGPITTARPT